MQVTETLNEGLKRKLDMVIPAADLNSRLDAKLNDLKSKANIKGFRPGKVPMAHLKKVYGRSAMSEAMQDAINASIQTALTERAEKAATQPSIELPEDQAKINAILDGKEDLTLGVTYEILPTFELMDFKKVKIEKPVSEAEEEEVERELKRLFAERREYEDKDGKAKNGDRVGLSFVGRIDGETFEGGSAEHAHLVLGSGQFVPGFEEQVVGLKKGDKKDVAITFPEDYVNSELAGKEAVFETEIIHVQGPKDKGEMDDEFAKSLGLDDLEALRTAIRDQIQASLNNLTQQRVKRLVLDALDEGHNFDLPSQLVDAEFEQIWKQVMHEIEHHGKTFESEGTTEEEARETYRKIAERRVRLGLVVAEIGNVNKIDVTQEEHQQALIAEVQRFPGQEQQVYDYYRENPEALASLRAPVFENKVIDFVTELAKVTDKKVTRNELIRAVEEGDEEGPISSSHAHDHDHDH
ncbi:MAG: trigger factor [Hyphomicrobiaceae bacterium]|nr:trigger factor [Hyphomicrobiaceae bacterium]MCC0023526.1 trigger factor [Hyphomicrobiaceae bacterium]